MRIGIDATPLVNLPRFGIHQHAYEVVRHLVRLYPDDQFVLFFDRDLCQRPSFDESALTALGPNAEPKPLRTFGPTARIANAAWLRWHLPREIARHRIDVFHGLAHAIPFTRRCPLVLTVHDLMPVEFLSWTPGDRGAIRVRRSLLAAIRRASAIAAVSESTKRDVIRTGLVRKGVPIEITTNAARQVFKPIVDQTQLAAVQSRYQLPPEFLLTVGADTPRRNYARLLHAFAAARKINVAVGPLVFVGNTDWSHSRVYQLAAELDTLDKVIFCRGVDDDDLAAMFTLAKSYICPSLHEGFGMPVIEALACGTPVICADIPALREVAGNRVNYFDPTDASALRAALLADFAMNSGPIRLDSTKGAAPIRFSWESAAATAHNLYTQACQHRGYSPDLSLRRHRSSVVPTQLT